MSNVRFLYNFKFDGAAISSSSEVAGLPDDNVVHEFVGKKWRSAGTTEWVKFDLGAAVKITMLAIFGHNLSSGAAVVLQGNDADDWGAPAFSQALKWGERAIVAFLDRTYRWWRVTFADGGNPDGYIEIGRICAGEYYEPGVNIHEDVEKRIVDPSVKSESEGRQGYAVEKPVYRVYGVRFADIGRPQQLELEAMFRAARTTRNLVFALDPDTYPEEETIYCMIATPLEYALGELAYGDVSIGLEEKV